MVVEPGVRRPDDAAAGVPHPEAEVHVVESHREPLVQAAHGVPHAGLDQHTGPGHGREVLHGGGPEHIAAAAPLFVLVAVAGVAPQPGDDPRVLDGIVGVIEHGSGHRAAARPGALAQQLGHPVPFGDLHIVVQQQKIAARGVLAPKVVDGREVEPLARILDHPQPVVAPDRLLIVGEGLGLLRVVLDDDDLVVLPERPGIQAVEARFQIVHMVFAGDQDADFGRALDLPFHPVGAGEQAVLDRAFLAGAGQMVRDGAPGRRGHIGLGVRAARGGPGMDPPVVQHLGQMGRAAHRPGQPEEQVVVLAAVVFAPLAPQPLEQIPAEHRQVADVVAAQQVVGRIIRLEVGHRRPPDVLFKQGLVAVEKAVRLACGPQVQDGLPHGRHGVGCQHIVVVGQGQIFPVCQGRRGVGVGRDAPVFHFFVYDLLIFCLVFPHDLPHLGVFCVRGVGQAELPVGGRLPHEGIQEGPQIGRRGVVQRGQDADGGQAAVFPAGPGVPGPLGFQHLFGGQIPGLFAEKAPPDKACRPSGHGGQAVLPGHRGRVAAQLPHPFDLLVHVRFPPFALYRPFTPARAAPPCRRRRRSWCRRSSSGGRGSATPPWSTSARSARWSGTPG